MDPLAPRHCPVDEAYQFSSPLISTEQFKEQCWEMIGDESKHIIGGDSSLGNLGILAEELQTDEQTVTELKDVCNVDNLECDYDKRFDYFKIRGFEDFPNDTPLETVKICKLGKTKQEEPHYVQHFLEPFNEDLKEDDELIEPGEVLISVALYHPIKRRAQQEFYVHANQKLSDLRDVICCSSDNIIMGEYSNNPDLTGAKTSKELTGSSFFMIENTFYNDTRNPLNRDYSKVIIDWAKDMGRHTTPGLGLFSSSNMQDVRFKDLSIRLGYPYLFCHQGNCEHIMVFMDMRLVHDGDVQKLSSYPVCVMEQKKKRSRCSVCNIHVIKWKTLNDNLAFEDPSYFCEKCFRYLHYTEEGKKLYPFDAYPCVDMEY